MIVAHPDDELIWCGGLILMCPDWDWTVLSLCRGDDPDRRPRFHRVCDRLGCQGLIDDLDDSPDLPPLNPSRDIGQRILRHVGAGDWGRVLTHGANGEYGHPRHRQVHRQVRRMVESAALRCEELWTFAYRCSRDGTCRTGRGADLQVELTEEILAEKRRLVRDVYGFADGSFELRACISPEAFRRRAGNGG